jgi:phage antirepressor YoqD-like protein
MNTSVIQFEQLSGNATRFAGSENVSRTEIVSLVDGEAVTTTFAIAAGCEVDHASVIKLVRTYRADLEEFGPFGFEIQKGSSLPQGGFAKATEYAVLNEQQSTLIMTYMRNGPIVREFKKRLVKEFWQMAHAKPAFDISSLNDPKVLLALLTDNVRKVVTLEADNTELTKENHLLEVKVEQDAPKVAFHDMVTVSHKRYNAAQAAKIIGTGRTRLLQFMRQKGWVTRTNEPYQAKIEAGLLDVKLGTFEHPIDGIVPTCSTLITGKGLTKLQAMWQSREEDLLT